MRTSITGLLLAEPSIARSWLEKSAGCSRNRAQSPAKEHSKAMAQDDTHTMPRPCSPLVTVELVHKAVSTAEPRWLASLVRWTESRTSLGSVLKFAGRLEWLQMPRH